MPPRNDISPHLIHFTKGASWEEALDNLLLIVGERRLQAGSGMIKGGYKCVCFTEAPIPLLTQGLINQGAFSCYSPFGLMFDKAWVFSKGGLPVIYQPDSNFQHLPEESKWRHVRYEPLGDQPIDFTWEREWRVMCEELHFSPEDAVLVVPDQDAENCILGIWDSQQDLQIESYSLLFGQLLAEQYRESFPWRICKLSA